MSTFGGPGGLQTYTKPTPPERGSFPLDHDGECKSIMASYLKCLRAHRGTNDAECRSLSKAYLSCRMDRNLMAPDSFKNLGFGDGHDSNAASQAPNAASQAPNAASQTPNAASQTPNAASQAPNTATATQSQQ